jgi:hypothetical protein
MVTIVGLARQFAGVIGRWAVDRFDTQAISVSTTMPVEDEAMMVE